MTDRSQLAKHFLELHRKGEPLLLANVWDAGSARLLESLGYEALATTSSGATRERSGVRTAPSRATQH